MNYKFNAPDGKFILCLCPYCKTARKRIQNKYNIVRRGYERNGLARFFCHSCDKWFNEKTGEIMSWMER